MKNLIRMSGIVALVMVSVCVCRGAENLLVNGGFEEGEGKKANQWSFAASSAPSWIKGNAHSGDHSLHVLLENQGAKSAEGLVSQKITGKVVEGEPYELSFWVKEINRGPGYLQQYNIKWYGSGRETIEDSGFRSFRGGDKVWQKVSLPLVAPEKATSFRLLFRFVTGAIEGGGGEAFIDDVRLVGKVGEVVAKALPPQAKPAVRESISRPVVTNRVPKERPPVRSVPAVDPKTVENDEKLWKRVVGLIDKGISKAEKTDLDQAVKDLRQLRVRRRNDSQFGEASELINLYFYSQDRPDQFDRSAARWLSRYSESKWGRDVLVDLVYSKVDQADFKGALPLIEEALKLYPEDEEVPRFKLLQKRVKELAEASE